MLSDFALIIKNSGGHDTAIKQCIIIEHAIHYLLLINR